MITTELPKRLAALKCPLCGEAQDIIVNGYALIPGTNDVKVNEDTGYAFCNCKNIWFAPFNEEGEKVYDQSYTSKYNADAAKNLVAKYETYIPETKDHLKFLEIGAASDVVLDVAASKGWVVTGTDIALRESNYQFVHANFEKFCGGEKPEFDYIFASHVFEHFRDPIGAVKKCHDLLNKDGILFVAMPDPYFIDFQNPYQWGHWHYLEHHIMWDMDSFCDVLKEAGFEIVYKKHNTDYGFICTNDFHIQARKI